MTILYRFVNNAEKEYKKVIVGRCIHIYQKPLIGSFHFQNIGK